MTFTFRIPLTGADAHTPILEHSPRVGIHDSPALKDVRWRLWALEDFYVQTVQAGVVWLAPRTLRTLARGVQ